MGEEAVLQNALGLEFIVAVNHGDFAGEVGEEQGFFDGGVASADDENFFLAVEEAIAGGAGRDAEALEIFFRWQVKPFGLGPGADDERVAGIDLATVAFEPDGLPSVPQLQCVLREKLWDNMINSMEQGARNRSIGKKIKQLILLET
jgi:hypothetical protein